MHHKGIVAGIVQYGHPVRKPRVILLSSQNTEIELPHVFLIVRLGSWTIITQDGMTFLEFSRLNKASHGMDALAIEARPIAAEAEVDHAGPSVEAAWVR